MVFNEMVIGIVLISIIVWVIVLTIGLLRMTRHYNRLTDGITKTGLRDILDIHLKGQGESAKKILDIEKELLKMDLDGLRHIQRVGIVRFNPFSDTGGAQSFTMALLDGKNNGVVMTSLYGRNGNRWYVKEIGEGVGKNIEVSKEEQNAIKQAEKM